MSFRNRTRNRRLATPTTLEIQSLESRLLLSADAQALPEQIALFSADPTPKDLDEQLVIMPLTSPVVDGGTVAVTVSKAGDISIIGDSKPNLVNLEIQGTTLLVNGAEATRFQLPGQLPQTALEVPLPSTIRSINVSLSNGNDQLNLKVQSDITINRDVTISFGNGEDGLILQVINADLKFNQNLTIDLGPGNDSVDAFTAQAGSLLVARDLTLRGGAGSDDIVMGDDDYTDIDTLYEPEAFAALQDNTEIRQTQRLQAGRDISIDAGPGNDRLTLLNTESGRDFNIAAAAGRDLLVASNLRSNRNLSVTEVEAAALQNITSVNTLTLRGSTGNDKLSLNRIAVNRLEIELGAGNDQLSLSESVNVKVASSVNGGTGSNSAYSGKSQPRITLRRTTTNLTSTQSLELLSSILNEMLGAGSGIMPAQTVLAE